MGFGCLFIESFWVEAKALMRANIAEMCQNETSALAFLEAFLVGISTRRLLFLKYTRREILFLKYS